MQAKALTVSDIFRPGVKTQAAVYDLALMAAGSILIALSAKVSVWIGPVPVTAQTLSVLMIAALLGPYRGAGAVLIYLAQGAAGLPVFAGGLAGAAYLFGPTGGYLFGFVAAAIVVGHLAARGFDRNIPTMALAMIVGNICIYAFGLTWLSFYTSKVLETGLYPFLAWDIIKIVVAALAMPMGWHLLRKRNHR